MTGSVTTRKEYGMTMAVLIVAAIGIIVAYGATWVSVTVPVFRGEPMPTREVNLTGSMLIGSGAASGWVAAACAAGIVATRRWGRTAIGVLAALAGAAAGIPAITFILSRGPLVADALAGDEALAVAGNAWWLVAAIAGLAVMVAGSITALRGRTWAGMSSRYERTPRAPGDEQANPVGLWDALDRGEDPTVER